MALLVLDLIVGIIQSFFISYTIGYCIEETKKSRLMILTILGTATSSNFLEGTFLQANYLNIIICHMLYILILCILYKNRLKEILSAYSVAYINLMIYALITNNLVFTYLESVNLSGEMNKIILLVGYIIQVLVIAISIMKVDFLKSMYKCVVNEKLHNTILVITFLLDYIVIICNSNILKNNKVVSNISEIFLISLIIILLFYFNKINNRTNNIIVLNKALEVKNTELRKIKHDYGAQISYLYGICLLNRYDELKGALKNIINNNENTSTAVEVSVNSNFEKSILSLALKPAVEKGINVLVDEKCDLNLINMNQVDLYRILSNIVNNAIRAMKGNGTIRAEAIEYFGSIIIKISNNGPKICKNDLENIFKPGFTTKNDNEEEHGFGLSIVKELIENNGGSISVLSDDERTEFKMILKML